MTLVTAAEAIGPFRSWLRFPDRSEGGGPCRVRCGRSRSDSGGIACPDRIRCAAGGLRHLRRGQWLRPRAGVPSRESQAAGAGLTREGTAPGSPLASAHAEVEFPFEASSEVIGDRVGHPRRHRCRGSALRSR
jgi:hypothetical protein